MSTQILSRYEILGTLGQGGMGEVLKARDLQLKRVVAIKRLLRGTLGDEEARARFLREARLAAQLNHPHIATIYDIFDSDGEAFIVMEYVEGDTIRERVARGPMPLGEVIELGAQIARALATAHKQNVIHRDIKSENIKVTPDGHVKVLDFGLAKRVHSVDPTIEETVQAESVWITQQGFAAGTPGYTAPEQWKGGQVDGRADIFSFGVVLYEMITGRAPFPGQSVIERITATMHNDPEPVTNYASVPNQLEHIVRKALAKDPNHRYQSMTELLHELERLKQQPASSAEQATVVVEATPMILAGRYRILAELGEGGMGKVYQAKDLKLDRTVAIKELRQGILADERARARFLREASLLAQLNHRNIAMVHDIIEEGNQVFIIMEYIEGERLLDKIKRGPLPAEEAYQYALEVAEALAEAHRRRIIHRDIKSANIMITTGGHAKVLDFGLAKQMAQSPVSETGQTETMAAELTGTRVTFGTPKYMSPEQRLTADVDERSDIFSYGVVLCEMLAGELKFMGEVVAELLEADPQAWPAPLNRIPQQWHALLKESLAKELPQRYRSFTELIADLKQVKSAAEARTEMATAVVERRVVAKEVEEARITPTLLRSAVALAPALYFLHQLATSPVGTSTIFYAILVFLAPVAVFFLPRVLAGRWALARQLVNGTHPRAFSLMMVNLIIVLLTSVQIFDFLGWQSWGDWRYYIRTEDVSPDIVLVAIDQTTKSYFDGQGVSLRDSADLLKLRQYHPQVLRRIAEAKPKVIAFDLFFSNISVDYDDEFAKALSEIKAAVPIVIGQSFDSQSQTFLPTTDKIRQALTDDPDAPFWGHPIVLSDQSGGQEFEKGIARIVPICIVQTRGVAPAVEVKRFPSISLLMATEGRYEQGWQPFEGVSPADRFRIPIDTSVRYVKNLPEGENHYEYDNLLVNFPRKKFQTVSYSDVLTGNTDQDFFQKYVLIGNEFSDFEPFRDTPIGQRSPYIIHASALNTILLNQYIRRVTGMPRLLVLLIVAYAVFALAIEWPPRTRKLLIVTAGVWVGLFAVAYFLFVTDRVWFDSSYPGLAAAVTGLLAYWKR
jgi:serine/threonine protein kinase/CHASE2 domain-containing sensor protein